MLLVLSFVMKYKTGRRLDSMTGEINEASTRILGHIKVPSRQLFVFAATSEWMTVTLLA